jgi:hypothetical protein
VVARLAAMEVGGEGENGVHATQLSCTGSLMAAGVSEDEAVEYILDATMKLPSTEGWDWDAEERRLRGQYTDGEKKFKKPAAPAKLEDVLTKREVKKQIRAAAPLWRDQFKSGEPKKTLVRGLLVSSRECRCC